MRRRLLFLVPFPPRPDARHGGARAVAQLLLRLAAKHDVSVLYLRDASEAEIDPRIAELCEHVHAIERRADTRAGTLTRLRRRSAFLFSLARGVPIWVQALDVSQFRDAVRRIVRESPPDLVQVEYHVMGQYLDAVGEPTFKLLVFHEPGEDAAGRAHADPSSILRGLDRRAWRIYERKILSRVDAVVVLTEADRRTLERRGVNVRMHTIPLGVEIPEAADPIGAMPPTVLFVGNFGHDPNVEAAQRLVHSIWPRVREHRPDALLMVVGHAPPAALIASAGADIEIHGSVPAVEPYVARAAVCVAPLRTGGGMRIKVLEALAAGKATVASPVAVAGLAVEDGRELIVADADEEFALAVVRLLGDEGLRRKLGRAARTWAVENAGADRTASAFDVLYGQLLDGRPSR